MVDVSCVAYKVIDDNSNDNYNNDDDDDVEIEYVENIYMSSLIACALLCDHSIKMQTQFTKHSQSLTYSHAHSHTSGLNSLNYRSFTIDQE